MMSFLFSKTLAEGRTLNLPESFSRVANNLINEKENELCGDSGYYQMVCPMLVKVRAYTRIRFGNKENVRSHYHLYWGTIR